MGLTPSDKILPITDIIHLDAYEAELHKQLTAAPILETISTLLTNEKNAVIPHLILALIKISFLDNSLSEQMALYPSFWSNAWKHYGELLFGREYPLHPQLDSFTLLKGRFLYFQYQEITQGGKEAILGEARANLWYAATHFHYYEAIDVLCWELITRSTDIETSTLAINLASQAAQYYLAPGYALLTKITNSCAVGKKPTQIEQKLLLYAIAYVALETTEHTLPFSEACIQIAYDFRPFASENKQFTSFDKARNEILGNMLSALGRSALNGPFFASAKVENITTAFSYIERIRNLKSESSPTHLNTNPRKQP